MNRYAFALLLLAAMIPSLTGCTDTCTGVECAAAPTPLEVVVTDTLSIDTVSQSTGMDTVMVVRRAMTGATVTLRSVNGTDTTTFETISPAGNSYRRESVNGLPSQPFVIVAERGGRRSRPVRAEVRGVEGCCPYVIVGRFEINLPQ